MSDWVSPTSNVANGWSNPTYAYNENTATYALSPAISPETWSSYLELYHAAISCSKTVTGMRVRYYNDHITLPRTARCNEVDFYEITAANHRKSSFFKMF